MDSPPGPLGHGIWLFEVCAHSAIRTSPPHCSPPPLQMPQRQTQACSRRVRLCSLGGPSNLGTSTTASSRAVLLRRGASMDHLGGPGDHAERDGRLVGQPGGDHHALLALHGTDTGAAGVPPRGDGRVGGLAEQERPAGCFRWPSTARQRSTQPPSRSSLWYGEPRPS